MLQTHMSTTLQQYHARYASQKQFLIGYVSDYSKYRGLQCLFDKAYLMIIYNF